MDLQSTNTLGIRDARARFYELLAKTKSGEEFIITKYGTPVARLIPLQKEDQAVVRSRDDLAIDQAAK